MEPPTDITDIWGVLAVALTTSGTVLVAWLTARAKRGSDRQDQDAGPVIEEVQKVADMQPAVDALIRQMRVVEAQLAEYRPIVHTKYPIAISHISAFHQLFPASGLQIPDQLRDDL